MSKTPTMIADTKVSYV